MRNLLLIAVSLVLVGCQVEDQRHAFPDLIDHHGVPVAAEDWSLVPFTDQGAWFGFALPPAGRDDLTGGFTGPFLMDSGRWLSPQLARLELANVTAGRSTGLPGMLEQEWQADDLLVTQQLWFNTAQTAVVESIIKNAGTSPRTLKVAWVGEVFSEMAQITPANLGCDVTVHDGSIIRVVAGRPVHDVQITEHRYRLPLADPVTVGPGDSVTIGLMITSTASGGPSQLLEGTWKQNVQRWNDYLDATADLGAPTDSTRILAVKAIQTMVNNWRGPRGRFAHGGLFPSSNVWYFNGFWAWDSWKHAVGLASFDPGIASDQLRLMFDHQDSLGMIADVVYLDAAEDNWRDTKPPLAGWALEEVLEHTGDLDLLKDLYPRLKTYHEFWYAHRDHDGDGLCEYGSTDGTIVAARWESGMDNAVRFDHTTMLQNGPTAWSMNQESVDLNSYLYREKRALHSLAVALGEHADATRWAAEAALLGERIRSAMYDEDTGWFYDIDIATGDIIPVQGPEGWVPLWAGLATEDQAARLRTTMLDTTKFRTHVPFPTVARDHPEFSEGYWRGLVWLDQVYFAIEGLRSYGYHDDAEALTRQVFSNLEGAMVAGVPLRENYHPLTGEGRNVKHFSWTAAHLLLLALEAR